MTKQNTVQLAYDAFGRDAGFTKKSGSWYGIGDEVIAVSNLQKSQYATRYYFNQGFFIRAGESEQYPKPAACHIQARLEGLLPETEERIQQLFDLSFVMPDSARAAELSDLLQNKLGPLIRRARTVAGLRGMLKDGLFAGAGLTALAQQVLMHGTAQ